MKRITLLLLAYIISYSVSAQNEKKQDKNFQNGIYGTSMPKTTKKLQKIKMAGEHPKFAYEMIVSTNYSSVSEAIKDFSKALIQNDIIPDKSDPELCLLTTEEFPGSKSTTLKLKVVFTEDNGKIIGKISAQGKVNMQVSMWGVSSTNEWMKVVNKGGAGSPIRNLYDGLSKVVKWLPCKIIDYTYEYP